MSQDEDQNFNQPYRPLLAATTGSGLMTVGVLQFTGSIWGSAEPLSQELIAIAARTTLLAFIMNAATLGLGFIVRGRPRPILCAILNVYGSTVFLVGAFLSGSYISKALLLIRPETTAIPESLQVFLGASAVGFFAILAALVITSLFDLFRRK